MPDLKREELEKKAEKEEKAKEIPLIAEFSYDNTLEETDAAMKTFQQNFASKRGRLSIIAYGILAAASVTAIIFNPSQVVLYLALAFCLFGLFFTLTDKKRMRTKVIETLKAMNPEDYICRIFEDRIEIETIIKPRPEDTDPDNVVVELDEKKENLEEEPAEEKEENAEELPEEEKEDAGPIKSVFRFSEDMLDLLENDGALLLVLARRQIYCFPKRCLSEEQQNTVREFLKKTLYREISDGSLI